MCGSVAEWPIAPSLLLGRRLGRVHEALKTTPAKALGVVDRAWAIGELIDAALATQPITPVPSAPDRRKLFRVVQGGRD